MIGIILGNIESGSGVISPLFIIFGIILAALIHIIEYKSFEKNSDVYRRMMIIFTKKISTNLISLMLGALVAIVISAALFMRVGDVSGNFIYFKF